MHPHVMSTCMSARILARQGLCSNSTAVHLDRAPQHVNQKDECNDLISAGCPHVPSNWNTRASKMEDPAVEVLYPPTPVGGGAREVLAFWAPQRTTKNPTASAACTASLAPLTPFTFPSPSTPFPRITHPPPPPHFFWTIKGFLLPFTDLSKHSSLHIAPLSFTISMKGSHHLHENRLGRSRFGGRH